MIAPQPMVAPKFPPSVNGGGRPRRRTSAQRPSTMLAKPTRQEIRPGPPVTGRPGGRVGSQTKRATGHARDRHGTGIRPPQPRRDAARRPEGDGRERQAPRPTPGHDPPGSSRATGGPPAGRRRGAEVARREDRAPACARMSRTALPWDGPRSGARGGWGSKDRSRRPAPRPSTARSTPPPAGARPATGARASMSGKGDRLDDAPMEGAFGSLETGLVQRTRLRSRRGAKAALFDYIALFHNRRRRSIIGCRTPGQARIDMTPAIAA